MAYLVIEAEVEGFITLGNGPILANHLESEDYLGGSTLRGALATIWPRGKTGNDEFLDLFCRGECRFLGLFPVAKEHLLSFVSKNFYPYRMPLSMKTCKYSPEKGHDGHGYHDSFLEGADTTERLESCLSCSGPMERVRGSNFYYFDYYSSSVKPIKVKKRIIMRHGADRRSRRARDEALYSYCAVEEGSVFVGWVIGKKDHIDRFGKTLEENDLRVRKSSNGNLEFSLRVGRARKKAGLDCVARVVESSFPWPEPGETLIHDKFVKIVLQTPAILKDHLFRPKTTLSPSDIFHNVNGISPEEFELRREFVSLLQIDGWSGIHGLPKVPEIALAPGSTFVFEYKGSSGNNEELKQAWEKIQIRGIGERRIEGYGQVLINPPTETMIRGAGK